MSRIVGDRLQHLLPLALINHVFSFKIFYKITLVLINGKQDKKREKTVEYLRQQKPMSLIELSVKIESQLEQYLDQKQTVPFANFII